MRKGLSLLTLSAILGLTLSVTIAQEKTTTPAKEKKTPANEVSKSSEAEKEKKPTAAELKAKESEKESTKAKETTKEPAKEPLKEKEVAKDKDKEPAKETDKKETDKKETDKKEAEKKETEKKTTSTKSSTTASAAKKTPEVPEVTTDKPFDFWMAKKLDHSKSILESLTMGDFEEMQTVAEQMRLLGKIEGFVRRRNEGYRSQQTAYDAACQELIRQAKRGNAEGATLAFNQLTNSCTACHVLLREDDKP